MKTDLDTLLKENQIDAILVIGAADHNPAMVYLTGGGHLTAANVLKKPGHPAVLFHGPMERGEAKKTGLKTVSFSRYSFPELLKESGGDPIKATALRYRKMLEDLHLTRGKIVLSGIADFGSSWMVFKELEKLLPDVEFTGERTGQLLASAMCTKDETEIERIRAMGKVTTGVVSRVQDWLTSLPAREEVLIDTDDQPLTIGRVKSKIDLWLAEAGAENPEGTIFAIGHDAGEPHSMGNPADMLRLGQTIVFDIYPCEARGGYFYDFTRTWCLGYATDEALQLYEQVLSVYNQIYDELAVGRPCEDYQHRTCELFEKMGHPTLDSDPVTEVGYVHSLGHGVGLQVHEAPWFSATARTQDKLIPGEVFTLEPGLYYPDRGLGVRIEDTLRVTPDGKFEILAEYPKELVLPVKGIRK